MCFDELAEMGEETRGELLDAMKTTHSFEVRSSLQRLLNSMDGYCV